MGKRNKEAISGKPCMPQIGDIFTATGKVFDPALALLFESSAGPVKVVKQEYSQPTSIAITEKAKAVLNGNRRHGSGLEQESSTSVGGEVALKSGPKQATAAEEEEQVRPRKRRRVEQSEDLENSYLSRLAREELKEERTRKAAREVQETRSAMTEEARVDLLGESDDNSKILDDSEDGVIPQHESLAAAGTEPAVDKAVRTVFLGNVSTTAIKSKPAKKALLNHISTVLAGLSVTGTPQKVESLRFRSTAFVSDAGPKKAAYAKRELMEDTTKSTNAYAVYTTKEAAQRASSRLNGTVVLDRHLRADYLAQPAKIEHKRCVFVGNLSFVDKEKIENDNGDEEKTQRRSKAKEPADAEEGLWRAFSRAGKVESVRVIRDKETRVGKGIAYVQFADENGVEAALQYNDKKFPPMLPRKLRVVRARKTKRQNSAVSSRVTDVRHVKRATNPNHERLDGRRTGSRLRTNREEKGGRGFVFEGHRASSPTPYNISGSKAKKRKPTKNSKRRGAAFKTGGGKRKAGE